MGATRSQYIYMYDLVTARQSYQVSKLTDCTCVGFLLDDSELFFNCFLIEIFLQVIENVWKNWTTWALIHISKCRLWLYMSYSFNLFVSFDKSMHEIYSIFLPKTTKLSMDTYLIWVLHPFDTEHISQVRFPLLVEVTGIGRGGSIGGGHSQNWKINRKQEKFD